jgi:hypothetical protein
MSNENEKKQITIPHSEYSQLRETYNALSKLYDPELGTPEEYLGALGRAITFYMASEEYNRHMEGDILYQVYDEVSYLIHFVNL